ncbi:MAG: InlB B-repeat-containing protein, partial [Clostridiales Family XIII bacterium]|nr:InlB B-repeat-containing protein [Clostridiales Family XIII bacterium]
VPAAADLPNDSYTIKLFSEEANGDNYTDFCSAPVSIPMTVDNTAPTTFTVTYNDNGGTNAPTDNTNYARNGIVTVAAAGSMTGPGGAQTFIGWSKTAPVSGDIIAPGSTFNIASDTTLYAVWRGDGSAAHPFVVSDAAELDAVRNDLTKHYILTADIDAGSAWVPIGYGGSEPTDLTNQFTGSFNGNGHAINIAGLAANITPGFFGNEWLGLFGVVGTGGTVKNLMVTGTVFRSSEVAKGIGGIAGCNTGTIKN